MGTDTRIDYRPRQNGNGVHALVNKPLPAKPVEPEGAWETGTLKFYDPRRSFGFIRSDDGHDALIHWRVLRKSGINDRDLLDDMPLRFKSQPVAGKSPECTIVRFA